jgi:hypothetical protein
MTDPICCGFRRNMADAEGEPVVKTAKQLEKEAKKLAKLEKFKGKLDKKSEPQPTKEKTEVNV